MTQIVPHDFLVNARFATRPLSGVDRSAYEIVNALASIEEEASRSSSLRYALPRHGSQRLSAPINPVNCIEGHLPGHLWEQLELSSARPRDVLISLCNTGPVFRHRQAVLIHDAQVYLSPESYSRPFRTWYKLMLPRLARSAGVVATVSAYSRDQLEKFGVIPKGKAHILHNGCDHIDRIQADPATMEKFSLTSHNYILAIGSLAPHKNLALLMEAAAARPESAPELVIAGGGNPKVFSDAGLSPPKGVRLLGRVTDEELKALYENALFLTFPSRTEGFGLPPLEAMRCGCPVIASTGGAIPEVCQDAALPVDPQDREGWTRAMTDLTASATERERLSRTGREHSRQFTWENTARKLMHAVSAEF